MRLWLERLNCCSVPDGDRLGNSALLVEEELGELLFPGFVVSEPTGERLVWERWCGVRLPRLDGDNLSFFNKESTGGIAIIEETMLIFSDELLLSSSSASS